MKTLLTLLLIISLVACTYKKDGILVKDVDGNIYKLKEAAANESYFLEKIDTASINALKNK